MIRPGPKTPSNRGLVGSTTALGARSLRCSISKVMRAPQAYFGRLYRGGRAQFQYWNCGISFNWSLVAL